MLQEQIIHLECGALLHDIGKIGNTEGILHNPGPLIKKKAVTIRMPIIGQEKVKETKYLRPAAPSVRLHQERYDGSGYPNQLVDESILLTVRVFLDCGVDTFDVVASPQTCNEAASTSGAREDIAWSVGVHFNSTIMENSLKTFTDEEFMKNRN